MCQSALVMHFKCSNAEKVIRQTGKLMFKRQEQKKTKSMLANQQRLFTHLQKHGLTYSLGYLLKSDGKYHEKGVDVNIAVDMLIAAYENQCDTIYLVSSDTDLLPAIKQAQKKGKQVTYVGFSHQLSTALVANCENPQLDA